MTDTPKRFNERDELTTDEEVAVQQAEQRGDATPQFQTPAYKAARREHLEAGGFDPDDEDAAPKPVEDLTTDEHFQQMRQGE